MIRADYVGFSSQGYSVLQFDGIVKRHKDASK